MPTLYHVSKFSTMKYFLLSSSLFIAGLLQQMFVSPKEDPQAILDRVAASVVCCGADENLLSTDARFMAIINKPGFAALHQSPVAFDYENALGNMIEFMAADGQPAQSYLVAAKKKSNKYLIVIHEWWGLNNHIKQEADKYYSALNGEVNVLGVDLYDGKIATTPDSAMLLIRAALSNTRKEAILKGALTFAGPHAELYSVGWCFGGMMSLQTAIMAGSNMKACIMYYGTPEKDKAKLASIQCPVLGIFGTQDKSIPNEVVDTFANDMKEAGKNFSLLRYDAVHAFANPSNPGYNKAFGEDAFNKSIAFLKSNM